MAVFRKRDTWWIDYYHEGRRHRQPIGQRRKDAVAALSQIRIKIAAGDFVPPDQREEEKPDVPPILFKDFARKEYLPWSKTEHSDGCRLHEITTKVEDYKTMRKRGRTPSGKKGKPANNATLNRELSCLKGVRPGRLPGRVVAALRHPPHHDFGLPASPRVG